MSGPSPLSPPGPDRDALAAHRALGRPVPLSLSRRRFIQLGAATAALAAAPSLLTACSPGSAPGVLVTITMPGANDYLNTLVPIDSGTYYDWRGPVALSAAEVLPLTGTTGLHPSLPFLKSLFDKGWAAAVEGVGMADHNTSHFTMMARWMRGHASTAETSGWLGRWLDATAVPAGTSLMAAGVGTVTPGHLIGKTTQAVTLPSTQSSTMLGLATDARSLAQDSTLQAFASSATGGLAVPLTRSFADAIALAPKVQPAYTSTALGVEADLTTAANIINAGLGTRLIDVTHVGFDTHGDEKVVQGLSLQLLDQGLQAFYNTLQPSLASRVTILIYTEFGRTPKANAGNGTDHGTAGCLFLLGPQVSPGLHGQRPSFTALDSDGLLVSTVDFRAVYATIISKWLGGDPTALLGATYDQLPLFTAGPK